jgi:hypothetical protein
MRVKDPGNISANLQQTSVRKDKYDNPNCEKDSERHLREWEPTDDQRNYER